MKQRFFDVRGRAGVGRWTPAPRKPQQQEQPLRRQRKTLRSTTRRLKAVGDYVVAGDIGGTNARFECWQLGKGKEKELVLRKKYPTASFGTFIDALLQFESDFKFEVGADDFEKPKSAAFAAAGVVNAHKLCKMTNLNWTISANEVQTKARWRRARVLNDFEAVGYGVLALEDESAASNGEHHHLIHSAPVSPKEPKVVLGPGTGFGQAQIFWNEKTENYKCFPSEGAHGDFAPRGPDQRALSEFIEKQKGYCELEHVCCGPGLENIYEFLSGGERRPAPDIAEAALNETDVRAYQAVVMFLSILGQEAGNWALRSLARGGVYIAGGITPKLIPILEKNACLEQSYLHKESRFSQVIESVPLILITNDDIGLSGSCWYAIGSL